jgi:hypothetical protein
LDGGKVNANPSEAVGRTGGGPGDWWWLPFAYDTMSLSGWGMGKAILGVEINLINITWNMKAVRELNFQDFDFAIYVEANASVGASYEAAVGGRLTGSNGTVKDQAGVNWIGPDGIPFNAVICVEWCGGVDGNYLGDSLDSFSWIVGYAPPLPITAGLGIDLGVDVVQASDYWLYWAPSTAWPTVKKPFLEDFTP